LAYQLVVDVLALVPLQGFFTVIGIAAIAAIGFFFSRHGQNSSFANWLSQFLFSSPGDRLFFCPS
jgi:hypothetical protein